MNTRTEAFIEASLNLIYRNVGFPGIGDQAGIAGSQLPGNLYIGILGPDGEPSYEGYSRQPVPRGDSGWHLSDGKITNKSDITFPAPPYGAGEKAITAIIIATSISGGIILHQLELEYPIMIREGVNVSIESSGLIIHGV